MLNCIKIWNNIPYLSGTWKYPDLKLASASDKVYQLLTHGQWFSPGTPASATTKTGYHDITEILLKMSLKHTHTKIKSGMPYCSRFFLSTHVQYPWGGF
jgi:hypothetical protein